MLEFQSAHYNRDSLRATLKVSGHASVASENIQIELPSIPPLETQVAGQGLRPLKLGKNWTAIPMLLGGGMICLFAFVLLIALVLFKNGILKIRWNGSGKSDSAHNTTQDVTNSRIQTDVNSNNSVDSNSFCFIKTNDMNDAQKSLMTQIEELNRGVEWTEGFAKLANALHLKDLDQDGYLLLQDARPVVASYSDIYQLGITESRLETVLAQSSNGQHVDIETLLRTLTVLD